jgi:hypothetical protein
MDARQRVVLPGGCRRIDLVAAVRGTGDQECKW